VPAPRRQPERGRDLDLRWYSRAPDPGVHLQPSAQCLTVDDAELDIPKRRAVEHVDQQLANVDIRGSEVEVGRESACVPSPELPERGPALEHHAEFERALVVEMRERVVLGDIEERRISATAPSSRVPGQVTLGDHRGGSSES